MAPTRYLLSSYLAFTTGHPVAALGSAALVVLALALQLPDFRIDASAESLISRDDQALSYYRSIGARYGSASTLIVAYTPEGDLFAPATIRAVKRLRDELVALEPVASVSSMVDVPLLESPPVTLAQLQADPPTLLSPDTDLAMARQELTGSPLYGNLVVGEAGRSTALHLQLKEDPRRRALMDERDALLEARLTRDLAEAEEARLSVLSDAVRDRDAALADRLQADIAQIRQVVSRHENGARIHLAGTALIVSDMIRFVWQDLRVFGTAVLAFIVVLLAVTFRRLRWVLITTAICAGAGIGMVGLLAWLDWRPTVVSSNFLSVLLVVTLSLVVHLIVRHQELHESRPDADRRVLVEETIRSKLAPSFYTAVTTMVAFGSLAVSDIEPVIDFGWMMVAGIAFSFVLTFLAFPSALMLLPPGTPPRRRRDPSGRLVGFLAGLVAGRARATLVVGTAVLALGVAGMARLGVEQRFIDYFDESTEIHQGMLALDRSLGGTTPFEVILEAPPSHRGRTGAEDGEADDALSGLQGAAGFAGASYWFDMFRLDTLGAVHDYLDELPQTGKVLSLGTAAELLRRVNNGAPLDNFTLSIIYARLPESVKDILIDPYLSPDGDQARISVRVFESDPNLDRDALLSRIRSDLSERFGLAPEQVRLTGLMVLYNDVLQSLFRSQTLTLGFVFVAIMLMLRVLFGSLRVAALAVLPNLLVAAAVLGLMGWLDISLDVMTVTIAAIVVGIAVDDAIHYTHRYLAELDRSGDHATALRRSHAGVGRAMLYTSVTITLGFAIFALSAFVPIVYFGLLAGFAMMAALVANLTLLPALLSTLRPRPAKGG